MMKNSSIMKKNDRVHQCKCYRCGNLIDTPKIYSEKERDKLKPYCATSTIATAQWLMAHGWHVTRIDAEPSGVYLCDDCYNGEPEYKKSIHCDNWCKQLEEWIETGDIKH